MHAMQYEITLPADYDMDIIRERVATRGSALDDFDGLGLKAYLIRERGDASPVNQYAPFYLWQSPTGMNRFLWGGGGFHNIVRDFGRPSVRHWTGVALEHGPARMRQPLHATRLTERIDGDPAAAVADALSDLQTRTPGVHSTALAVDPFSWELVRFTLWAEKTETAGDHYQVLHLSSPALKQIPTGRHW
ncbi:DUF4865 family protein [Actinomadura sp. DC4]|uniref:DUF4865 family protein n=1 Tax=Actinomadura sp. DC4 TaxID=3055069 RepID=UPI0025B1412E|nr:DUF4865 family protein [Actinomadura sp. DC4]MDN3360090.1 DUF4865 family protein [Actinomadura sp. DC4]